MQEKRCSASVLREGGLRKLELTEAENKNGFIKKKRFFCSFWVTAWRKNRKKNSDGLG